jgi:hypothetical protein
LRGFINEQATHIDTQIKVFWTSSSPKSTCQLIVVQSLVVNCVVLKAASRVLT